jgi:hypothetical protein
MSKAPNPPSLDRRRLARLAVDGVSTALLAELAGLPRLELEAALQVDPQLAELRRHYERLAAEPPEARLEHLRRLLLASVEHHLEAGDLRNIGWALKGLGLLRPLPGSAPAGLPDPPLPEGQEEEELDRTLGELDESERELWERMDYRNWPVPPTIPWRPGAPRPRGPFTIENEAGTEAERAAAPLPWPPPRRRPEAAPPSEEPAAPAGGEAPLGTGPDGQPSPDGQEEPGPSRWPPHLRPV